MVKLKKDEFGFIIPKHFNFTSLADVERVKLGLKEQKNDYMDIISIINYKPRKIAYRKFKGTLEQLIKAGYTFKGDTRGWIRKLPNREQFHLIVKDDTIYLHKDRVNKYNKHYACIDGVDSEIKRILKYKNTMKIEAPKKLVIVKKAKRTLFERIKENIREVFVF